MPAPRACTYDSELYDSRIIIVNRVLVTGAQGLLGRYFTNEQLGQDESVEILGIGRSKRNNYTFNHEITLGARSLKAPLPSALRETSKSSRYNYDSLDVCNTSDLVSALKEFNPGRIIHLASGLRDDPTEHLFRTNVLGTESLYLAIARANCLECRVVVVTSGSVYGSVADDRLPLIEGTEATPFDTYSVSKYAQERMAIILGYKLGISTIIARVFNVVAPGQDERHLCGKLASQLIAIETNLLTPKIFLESIVTTRDFIDARDVARFLVILSIKGKAGEAYNVASGQETRIQSIVDELISLTLLETPLEIERKPHRSIDMARNFASIKKLAGLGIGSTIPLSVSLSDVLDYYRWCHTKV